MEEQEFNEKSKNRSYPDKSGKQKNNDKKNITTTVIIFIILLLLILGFKFYLTKLMPEYMLNQGKKYLEAGQYDKALKMFESAENGMPLSEEPVYYRAITLSKMPPTSENQKALYEIAQLDDCDKASDYADQTLMNLKKDFDRQIGPNYSDNVLYEDKLVRWNNSEPITFSITSNYNVPNSFYDDVRNAFRNWQSATNGAIVFKEIANSSASQIAVTFTDNITVDNNYDPNRFGNVEPNIKDSSLLKMNVNLRGTDNNGQSLKDNQVLELAQHEIGHALGLWGHSAYDNDVMSYNGDYVYNDETVKPISQRDVNTLLLVYNMIPDVIDKPLTPEQMKNMYYHYILTTYPGENFEVEIQRLFDRLRQDRNNIVTWVDLAINYGYKRQYAKSNYILNKVLPLTYNDLPNEQVVLYNLAANYYKMRDYKTSEKYLHLATNIKDDMDTQILESFLDYRLGRIDIAREKLIHLNKVYPDNIEVALKLVEVYYKQKDKEKEKLVINNLIKNNPRAVNDRRVRKYRKVLGN